MEDRSRSAFSSRIRDGSEVSGSDLLSFSAEVELVMLRRMAHLATACGKHEKPATPVIISNAPERPKKSTEGYVISQDHALTLRRLFVGNGKWMDGSDAKCGTPKV